MGLVKENREDRERYPLWWKLQDSEAKEERDSWWS